MSWHSDSELFRAREKTKAKRNLHITLKAKSRGKESDEILRSVKALLKKQQILSKEENMLIIAASTNNTELLQILLEKGVQPNIVDNQDRSPLHLAVSKGYTEIVDILLAYGANKNMQDVVGNTPLHLAACTSNLKIITTLINAGADVMSLDLHGRSPLELAQSKLHILKRHWKSGAIEMIQLRKQLEQITDVMIAMRKRDKNLLSSESDKTLNLEMMKLSINSSTKEEVDNQILKLEEELTNFSLK